jgi:hypothetical protein
MVPDPCFTQTVGRRRMFWTTQPRICGDYFVCGVECGIPGLEYEDNKDPAATPYQAPFVAGTETVR